MISKSPPKTSFDDILSESSQPSLSNDVYLWYSVNLYWSSTFNIEIYSRLLGVDYEISSTNLSIVHLRIFVNPRF